MSAPSIIAAQNTTADVKRPTYTVDSGGAPVLTFATVSGYSAVPVFVQDNTGTEGVEYQRLTGRKLVIVFADPAYTFQEQDTLTVGSRTLNVKSIDPRALRGSNVYTKLKTEEVA